MKEIPRILLVSFADGAFRAREPQFRLNAQEFGIFSDIWVYNLEDLDENYLSQHGKYIKGQKQKKGFGYYIWKPQVLLQALKQCGNVDLVCWVDAGFTFNPAGINRFIEYAQMALSARSGMISFFNVHTESVWTKQDLAVRLGLQHDPMVMGSSQLASGFFLFRPTVSNEKLIESWKQLSLEHEYHFSDDSLSIAPNVPEFREHRHDQSIFSLLRKAAGFDATFYEVQDYGIFWQHYQSKVPCWATRLRY